MTQTTLKEFSNTEVIYIDSGVIFSHIKTLVNELEQNNKKLIEKNIVVLTRNIGNAKLFALNKEDEFVKKIVKFDWEITKLEIDKAHEREITV